MTENGSRSFFAIVGVLTCTAAAVVLVIRPVKPKAWVVDDLEARLTITLRLELSRERALRVYPALTDPDSDLSRRMAVLYSRWLSDNDDRLRDPDMPFLLARAAHDL